MINKNLLSEITLCISLDYIYIYIGSVCLCFSVLNNKINVLYGVDTLTYQELISRQVHNQHRLPCTYQQKSGLTAVVGG